MTIHDAYNAAIQARKAQSHMDAALSAVQRTPVTVRNIGPVAAMIPVGYDEFIVVCHRPNVDIHRAFSTHRVTCAEHIDGTPDYSQEWLAWSGHYDMSPSDAIRDMISRAGY